MSKKHFNALALAVRQITNKGERGAAAFAIGKVCEESNANFDWCFWRKACGLEEAD